MELLNAFLEDLGQIEDDVAVTARECLASEPAPMWAPHPEAVSVLRSVLSSPEQIEALETVATDLVHIALHSALVVIDGGAASAEGGSLRLVDEHGESVGEGLHELFVDHLFESGRMEEGSATHAVVSIARRQLWNGHVQ